MNLESFREAVDATAPRLRLTMELPEMAATLGRTPPEPGTRGISKLLQQEIVDAFPRGRAAACRQCVEMAKDLVFEHRVAGVSVDPYLRLLEFLRDALRAQDDGQSWSGDWRLAIQSAWDAHGITPENVRASTLIAYQQTVWSADAGIRLHAIGRSNASVPVEKVLTLQRHTAIVRYIERQAAHLGGEAIARYLFGELAAVFDPSMQRYHFVNRFPGLGHSAPGARVPANYVLQLAAKYPVARRPINSSPQAWSKFREDCIAYAAMHAVQPFSSVWVAWSTDPREHAVKVRELALHDSLFTLQQTRVTDVIRISRGMVESLRRDDRIDEAHFGRVCQALAITAAIFDQAGARLGPTTLSIESIQAAVPDVPPDAVRTLMRDVLSHPVVDGRPGANQRFVHPSETPDRHASRDDRSGSDFAWRPLIALDRHRFLLLDRAACSVGALEALQALLRSAPDSHIGKALESFVVQALVEAGFHPKWGTYTTHDGESDCDAVLECDAGIILFEVKKKALTGLARTGVDADGIIDLAKSLVKAQTQLGRHEYRLREFERLQLHTEGGTSSDLALEGRRVMRIALSLSDYGAFQDNRMTETLLYHHAVSTFDLVGDAVLDGRLRKSIDEVNVLASDLREVNQRLYDQAGQPQQWQPYAHCLFMSVSQLLVFLDGKATVTQLWNELNQVQRLQHGSRDLYFEVRQSRRLQGLASSAQPNG